MKLNIGSAYTGSVYGVYENGTYIVAPSFNNVIEAIRATAKMGYDGIELETLVKQQVIEVYNPINIKRMAEVLSEVGIKSPHFNIYHLTYTLSSPKPEERKDAVRSFQDVIPIAQDLGANLLILPASPIPGVKTSPGRIYPGGPPETIEVTDVFSWEKAWATYVDVIGQCADIAGKAGLKIAVEPRPREIITNADSMLRLIHTLDRPNLGVLIDTAHLFVQKEILPIAIQKLRGHIYGLHLADNDGNLEYHWAPGKGSIDWPGVLRALKRVGFDDYMTVEVSGVENLDKEYNDSRDYLVNIIKAL